MLRRRKTIIYVSALAALVFFFNSIFADNLYLSQNARTFDTQQSSLIVKGVAHACLALTEIPDSLPCNPSMLPRTTKPHLGLQALLSNGYATLDKMRKLLAGTLDQDTINSLFSQERVLQIEGNGELDFISNYFAARYTPITIKYFSVIRNEANPEVELSAVQESNVVLQGAYPVTDWLNVGIEGKQVARKFIKERFQLVALATDAGKNLLQPQQQQGFLFSPAATVFLPGAWKPRVVVMGKNLVGGVWGDTEQLNEEVDAQAGVGITIPMGWTVLDLDFDYRALTNNPADEQRYHLGAMLRFGTMWLTGGADYFGFSGGIYYGLEQINAGILFTTTQTPWNSNDYYANTVYLQVGWQI